MLQSGFLPITQVPVLVSRVHRDPVTRAMFQLIQRLQTQGAGYSIFT